MDGQATVGGAALFVGGEWKRSRSPDVIATHNPASGEAIGVIAAAGAADVDDAVQCARRAFEASRAGGWKPADRQNALLALADKVEQSVEDLVGLDVADAGRPISAVRRVDIPVAVMALRYFAGWPTKLGGETSELSLPGSWHAYTVREPVGVVAQIIPWNYPFMGAVMKIAPALAAGCAVILKPAELTSLSALRLAELASECGIPPGLFNVVTGLGGVAGAALVEHPGVDKISFTGSTATGKSIVRSAAATLKRVTVELGGKSPVIVMPDADLEAAARAIAASIFLNSGQTCSAGSRLLVHAKVASDLVARIVEIGRGMGMGDPADPATVLGPLISRGQRDKVHGFVERARSAGARCATGGALPDGPGYFYPPTVLTDVRPGMPAVDEEIFGPVLSVMTFDTWDVDTISGLANDNAYGLAAYVWTSDLSMAHRLTGRLRAGTVRVNAPGGGDFAMPTGGMKASGFGRENGRVGVEAYTELKSVALAY